MMVAFGIIAALTLGLIFVFLKLQGAQKEANVLRMELRRTARHASDISSSKDALALTWQGTLADRLNAAHRKGLLSEEDAMILKILFGGFSDLLHRCLNEGKSLEEGLAQYLAKQDVTVQDIKEVIKKYPKDVRLAWSKNSAEGLIIALTKLSDNLTPHTKKENKEVPATEKESS